MKTHFKILLTALITVSLLLGFALPVNMVGNWYQQFMPNMGGQQINDIFFLDSLTGYAVASRNVNPDTASILKTTNGGNNWQVIFTQTPKRFYRIHFINQNTGYVCGGSGGGTPNFFRTTNGGVNWLLISTNGCALWKDMSVIDENNIWLVDDNSLCGGVYYSSNGGVNWDSQLALGSQNPDHIYMFNARIGFIGEYGGTYLRKTTNSGINWNIIENGGFNGFSDMYFTDSLTGWRAISTMKKTTDGGNTWITQTLPGGGQIITSTINRFSVLNRDTIWGVGGQIFYGGSQTRGIVYRTTNGGNNWQFQAPDTAYNIFIYNFIKFTSKLNGWAYSGPRGVHTTTGGDPVWVTGIKKIGTEIPKDYKLFQNYPNPFNPRTVISYNVKRETSNVKLIVFDIQGKEMVMLVNQKQNPGTYQVDFSGNGYSSGVYFYSLIIDNKIYDTKKMVLLR